MTLTRRAFCGGCVGGAAVLASCGNPVSSPPGVDVMLELSDPTSQLYGTFTLELADTPQLASAGGALIARIAATPATDMGSLPFYVPQEGVLVVRRVATDGGTDGGWVAVQALCPHQQCPLGYASGDDEIECPCHGSRFRAGPSAAVPDSYIGEVLHPPAKQALRAWAIEANSDSITVDLKSLIQNLPTVVASNGTVSLPLAKFTALAKVGGAVTVSVMGQGDTLLVAQPTAGAFVALNAICPHAGCTVGYDAPNTQLLCPCHGSEFTTLGAVKRGPATSPLATFTATSDGTNVSVKLS